MDLKEIGACGAVVMGGAAFGISQMGLNDVLSDDLKHMSAVSYDERPAYMNQVVTEFTETFASYTVPLETHMHEGYSKFSANPADGSFIEIVTQAKEVPQSEYREFKASLDSFGIEGAGFCSQAEMTMFTNNGWTYRFTVQNANGRQIYSAVCEPTQLKLRGMS